MHGCSVNAHLQLDQNRQGKDGAFCGFYWRLYCCRPEALEIAGRVLDFQGGGEAVIKAEFFCNGYDPDIRAGGA